MRFSRLTPTLLLLDACHRSPIDPPASTQAPSSEAGAAEGPALSPPRRLASPAAADAGRGDAPPARSAEAPAPGSTPKHASSRRPGCEASTRAPDQGVGVTEVARNVSFGAEQAVRLSRVHLRVDNPMSREIHLSARSATMKVPGSGRVTTLRNVALEHDVIGSAEQCDVPVHFDTTPVPWKGEAEVHVVLIVDDRPVQVRVPVVTYERIRSRR